MTTVALPRLEERTAQPGGNKVSWAVQDTLTVTWRNLKALMRTQEQVFFAAVQPIMFTLLFVYVFGGAIHTSVPYVDYLIPGIYVQTVAFGAVTAAVGLSEDLARDRLSASARCRWPALPCSAAARPSDLVRNVFVVILITAVGFAVGFRISTNVGLFLLGALIVLLFSYTLCWGFATVGLSAPNAETAQTMVFPILFPFIFASSAFVPVAPCRVGCRRSPPTSRSRRWSTPAAR